jgi:hypothetical protein
VRGNWAATSRAPLVAGTAAVALMLFGTRWSAYLGFPPLFLTDVLIALALVHFILSPQTKAGPADGFQPRILLLGAVFGWALIRFILGWRFDALALRDAVPYLYAILGIVAGSATARTSSAGRQRTAQVLIWALGLHAAWVALSTVFPAVPESLPVVSATQELHVFTTRTDVDTAFNGVFAAWLLTRVMISAKPIWPLVGFLATWVIILQTTSRAGVLAAATVTFLGFISVQKAGADRADRRKITVAIAPLILVAMLWALPQTTVGERFEGTFGASQSEAAMGAAGTARARDGAWTAIWRYVQADEVRYWFGVGFGPDLMGDSNAGLALIGTDESGETMPRSPHNYWVGTVGRLGVVGLLLIGLLAAVVLLRAWRQVSRPVVGDNLGLVSALVAVSVLPVATLGVVLESPFGAVPFFWAAGVLFSYPSQVDAARPRRWLSRPHVRDSQSIEAWSGRQS